MMRYRFWHCLQKAAKRIWYLRREWAKFLAEADNKGLFTFKFFSSLFSFGNIFFLVNCSFNVRDLFSVQPHFCHQHYHTRSTSLILFASTSIKSHLVHMYSLEFPRSCSNLFVMFVHTKDMQDNNEN